MIITNTGSDSVTINLVNGNVIILAPNSPLTLSDSAFDNAFDQEKVRNMPLIATTDSGVPRPIFTETSNTYHRALLVVNSSGVLLGILGLDGNPISLAGGGEFGAEVTQDAITTPVSLLANSLNSLNPATKTYYELYASENDGAASIGLGSTDDNTSTSSTLTQECSLEGTSVIVGRTGPINVASVRIEAKDGIAESLNVLTFVGPTEIAGLETVGVETPTLGTTAPIAGLSITQWLQVRVAGVDGYIPFFSL